MFNLKSDPYEKTNLAGREPAKLAEMRARLDAYTRAAVPAKGAGATPRDYKAPAIWGETN